MDRADGRLAARVVFVMPAGAPPEWRNHGGNSSSLWQQAEQIHGVDVSVDEGGKQAKALGAAASGDVSVFDSAGRLEFKGGITDGRGHEGDNEGLFAILALLDGQPVQVRRTPVYGCELIGDEGNRTWKP
jgi:hypothetical protein